METNELPNILSCSFRVKSGQKIVEEEDLKTGEKTKYRDEHSGPFSWKTRSQQVAETNTSSDSQSPT